MVKQLRFHSLPSETRRFLNAGLPMVSLRLETSPGWDSRKVNARVWIFCGCIVCVQCDHMHVTTCILLTFITIGLKEMACSYIPAYILVFPLSWSMFACEVFYFYVLVFSWKSKYWKAVHFFFQYMPARKEDSPIPVCQFLLGMHRWLENPYVAGVVWTLGINVAKHMRFKMKTY